MPGRPRLLDHRLEHLAGADDGLAKLVALGDQHNLCGDLNSHVATGNYGTITCLVDFGLVLDSLLILDLGDDPDALSLVTQSPIMSLNMNECVIGFQLL